MKEVALFFGGKSVEHDISIITALQVMSMVPKEYKLLPVYITIDAHMKTADNLTQKEVFLDYKKNVKNEKDVSFSFGKGQLLVLKNGKVKKTISPEVAILCCHGNGGEDGALQGALELAQIPYTSPCHYSSAICMDKALTKMVLEKEEIPSPKYVQVKKCEFEANSDEICKKIGQNLPEKVIIKPAKGGSSVGVQICEDALLLPEKLAETFEFDDKVIVEEFFSNAEEYFCAILKMGDDVFVSRIDKAEKSDFFTFEEKYLKEKKRGNFGVGKNLQKRIVSLAKKSFASLDCDGVVRVDFLYQKENDLLLVNELNTIPGSLAFNLFDFKGEDFIKGLIISAKEKAEKKRGLIYQYNSSAIENFIAMSQNRKGQKMLK